MLFVDNINKKIVIADYLRFLLPPSMRPTGNMIIRILLSNLEAKTKNNFMQDFKLGNTQIWVCTNTARMGIDLQNIAQAI